MEIDQLILFALSLIAYFILHSLLAHKSVKSVLIKRWIDQRYYRLAYNFIAILSALPLVWIYRSIPSRFVLETQWLSYLGLGIFLIGGILLLIALKQYDLSEFSGTQQLRQDKAPASSRLKKSGFNAIVRHPLYFSMLLIFWGWFLFHPSDAILVIAIICTIYLYVGTKLEEEKLILEFGAQYLQYQKEVKMLIPKIL